MPERSPNRSLSRREWLRSFVKPRGVPDETTPPTVRLVTPPPTGVAAEYEPNPAQVAVIAGRYCLAYQHSFCTTCSERCPVPGAIVIEKGFPRVVSETCTGCALCHAVCPAPEANAIRLLPRRPAPSQP